MNEYREIRDRRIDQFTRYLQRMCRRQQDITSGHSFLIFAEDKSELNADKPVLHTARAAVAPISVCVHGVLDDGDPFDVLVPDSLDMLVTDGFDSDESNRFIQFSFNPRYFDIDLPNTTLYAAEAAEILERRVGFFRVRSRRQFEHPQENASEFDPLRRVYIFGDERTAAEDLAFIWFDVWKFPVDYRFFVTAAAFHEDTNWESDRPLEVDSVVTIEHNAEN